MPAAIDTGTSLIAGPTEDVAAIWATVPGSGPSPSSQGFFNFRSSLPLLSFSNYKPKYTHSSLQYSSRGIHFVRRQDLAYQRA